MSLHNSFDYKNVTVMKFLFKESVLMFSDKSKLLIGSHQLGYVIVLY